VHAAAVSRFRNSYSSCGRELASNDVSFDGSTGRDRFDDDGTPGTFPTRIDLIDRLLSMLTLIEAFIAFHRIR